MAFGSGSKKEHAKLLKKLQSENTLLMEENRKLNDTVGWMHDTIWRLINTQHSEQ